ncbi:hypothetical protein [Prosthecobacter sp.]|uniref:hypothetical protein n=1 Tax=Prosthecobacter sp. TaxID=1965333 RepID=UPI003784BA96
MSAPSFAPVIRTGPLPAYDLDETIESGLLTESVKFTPIVDVRKKMAHVSATAIAQTVQTRTLNQGLQIDIKGSIIPDANGLVTGRAAGFVGECITCAHFASASSGAIIRHGYTRDDTKALQIQDISTDLGNTDPADVSFKAEYLPYVTI